MTLLHSTSRSFGLLFCILWLLAGSYSATAARHHQYVNKHTVSTTRVVAAGITVLRGRASWYGRQFQGHRTTSGELFNRFQYTCAHRTLPFGTRLRVTNVKTQKSVVVRVSDRGPFRHQRIIDLAEIAARPLGIVEQGAATVVAEVVDAATPLGPTDAPSNLLALLGADPDPSAAHATYEAPAAEEAPMLAVAPPTADSAALVAIAAPVAAPIAATPVAAPVIAPAKPRFVLQAGTFTDPQNALAMKANLALLDRKLAVTIVTETVDGRELHRVLIADMDSWLAAETVHRRLQLWGIASLVRQLPAEELAPVALVAVAPASVATTVK